LDFVFCTKDNRNSRSKRPGKTIYAKIEEFIKNLTRKVWAKIKQECHCKYKVIELFNKKWYLLNQWYLFC